VALTFEFSVASFGGMSMAEAASNQAKSLAELLDQRSPGARTAGVLTKTKVARALLADREAAPKPVVPKNLAEVLAPPLTELVPTDLDVPVAELTPVVPSPPGVILLPPPPGGVVPPGGKPPPGGPPSAPPPNTPPPNTPPGVPPPAVPEPGTWMTMILGFGLIGWSLRRSRACALASSAGRVLR
jgi:hypothetical protein